MKRSKLSYDLGVDLKVFLKSGLVLFQLMKDFQMPLNIQKNNQPLNANIAYKNSYNSTPDF